MSPARRADSAWPSGSAISWPTGSALPWPTFRRPAGPLESEFVFKSPGLELLARQVAGAQRSQILDLGVPRGANLDYLAQFPCVLHFGDLPRALDEDPGMSSPEEERDVAGAVDRVLDYGDGLRFDTVLAWDLFDYLDGSTVAVIARRLSRFCRTGTLLYLTTSNRDTISDAPGRFTIVDDRHLRFERAGIGTRDGRKHSPRGLERIMPGFHLRHSFLLEHEMQDYLFSHV